MEIQKTIIFNGTEYRLMGAGRYYLSQSKSNEGRKGAKSLHVAIWEFHNGEVVPEGYHIHHKDGDHFNNDISNLELVNSKEHLSKHGKERFKDPEYARKNKEQLAEASEKAKEWHRSEEGRKWHSEHGKRVFGNRESIKKNCKQCGKSYDTINKHSEYCSDNCGVKWRTKHIRVQYTATCVMCGETFTGDRPKASKNPVRKTCSKTCTNKLNHLNRKNK